MLSVAPPYLDHALDLPLDFPLDTPLDVATFNDILARIKAMSPLVATDSRLLNPANALRPLSGGDVAGFDGLTQFLTIPNSTDYSSSDWSVELVFNLTASVSAEPLLSQEDGTGTGRGWLEVTAGKINTFIGGAGAQEFNLTAVIGTWHTLTLSKVGTTYTANLDGAEDSLVIAGQEAATGDFKVATSKNESNFSNVTLGSVRLPSLDLYRLGETTGPTALDSSGNGNHGTYVNNPTLNVPDNTVPYSAWNQLGGSERMYFDGVDDKVTTSSIALVGDFFIEFTMVANDDAGVDTIFSSATGSNRMFIGANRFNFTLNGTNVFITYGVDISEVHTYRIYRTGTTLSLDIDGAFVGSVSVSSDTPADPYIVIGGLAAYSSGIGYFNGIIYNVNLDDQASYLGTGNQASDWLDQIGSNNGTVTGGEVIRIPRNESNTALDVLGSAVQYSGTAYPVRPIERQSNALSFDGATQYVTLSPIDITDASWSISMDIDFTRLAHGSDQHVISQKDGTGLGRSILRVDLTTNEFSSFIGGADVDFGIFATSGTKEVTLQRVGNDLHLTAEGTTSIRTPISFEMADGDLVLMATKTGSLHTQATAANVNINGLRFPLAEGAGGVAYNTDGTNHATLVGNPTWVLEDGIPSSNLDDGFSLYEHVSLDPLRVPYGDDRQPLTITPPTGYTKTSDNPAVVDGHNDAETELDFYNVADGGTTPEILASGVAITDYTFGDSVTNPLFKRSISSVSEDRHTLFPAVLIGDDLETANEYTL